MNKLTVGQQVSISVFTLYNQYGEHLTHCIITTEEDDEGNTNYYDLQCESGRVACMDGETCIVCEIEQSRITFMNDSGEVPAYFKLTNEEVEYALIRKEY